MTVLLEVRDDEPTFAVMTEAELSAMRAEEGERIGAFGDEDRVGAMLEVHRVGFHHLAADHRRAEVEHLSIGEQDLGAADADDDPLELTWSLVDGNAVAHAPVRDGTQVVVGSTTITVHRSDPRTEGR